MHSAAGSSGQGSAPSPMRAAIARPRQTVVIYMGVGSLPVICAQLIAHGLSPDTPAAVVERATLPEQRTVAGSLQTLPTLALVHDVKAPALIIIGGVVALHEQLGDARAGHAREEIHAAPLAAAGLNPAMFTALEN